MFGQIEIDEAEATAQRLDSITYQLGQSKLQDVVDGGLSPDAMTARAASLGGLPHRSIVLLMADKCHAIMRKVALSKQR